MVDPDLLVIAGRDDWISSLPTAVRAAIREKMQQERFEAGEQVLVAGAPPRRIHQVVSGYVKLIGQHANGEQSLITIYSAGNCFSETAVVADRPLHHTVQAMTDATVAYLKREHFWQLYKRHPEIPEALCRKFAQSLSRSVRNREIRETMSLARLVAMVFANLSDVCAGATSERGIELAVPITQADIGAVLGVTRQSVQTAMIYLRSRSLVEKQGGVWIVRDRERLLDICRG